MEGIINMDGQDSQDGIKEFEISNLEFEIALS
jgi:hypothetical protein